MVAQRDLNVLSDDELYRDWVAWIERIYQEAVNQGWNHRMFRLVGGIFQQNSRLQHVGGFLWDWLAQNYVAAAAMTLRRELDRQAGTENLLGLLHEMRERPAVIDRKRFRATWGSDDYWDADRAFDNYPVVRSGEDPLLDHLDPTTVAEDIAALKDLTTKVRQHVERTIAHRTPTKEGQESITFDEFHAALRAVEDVFKRYYVLLKHSDILQTEPVAQFDEFEPFRFSWIENNEEFDYDKCK